MMLRVTFRGMAKLNAVGFVVTDLERAVKFYRLLGVPFPEGAEKSEHGHADVVLDGGMRMMIDTEDEMRKFDQSWKRAGGSHAAALAFDCERPNAVDELVAQPVGEVEEGAGDQHQQVQLHQGIA